MSGNDGEDRWQNGQKTRDFNAQVHAKKRQPSPQELEKAGIKTESVFDARKTLDPKDPKQHLEPDGMDAAERAEIEKRNRKIDEEREKFREQFRQARLRFNDLGRERE